jgi:hypothetical protein
MTAAWSVVPSVDIHILGLIGLDLGLGKSGPNWERISVFLVFCFVVLFVRFALDRARDGSRIA